MQLVRIFDNDKDQLYQAKKGGLSMQATFYDVKTRQKVEADVTDKKSYQVNGVTRYAVKGKTSDGRNLTKFVSKADFDSITL